MHTQPPCFQHLPLKAICYQGDWSSNGHSRYIWWDNRRCLKLSWTGFQLLQTFPDQVPPDGMVFTVLSCTYNAPLLPSGGCCTTYNWCYLWRPHVVIRSHRVLVTEVWWPSPIYWRRVYAERVDHWIRTASTGLYGKDVCKYCLA